MLPYFSLVSFRIGDLIIYVWGFCVAIGFLAGILTAYFVCKSPSFSPFIKGGGKGDFNKIFNLSILLLIFGLFGARVFWWLENINEINSIWQFLNIRNGGLSSLGGFVFAGIVLVVWFVRFRACSILFDFVNPAWFTKSNKPRDSRNRTSPKANNEIEQKEVRWRCLDVLAIGFVPLWIFSRLGCFLIHDHPGRLSDFFLAVNFSGGARFDMALLEIILMAFIGASFLILKIWSRARERAQIPLAPQEAGLNPPLKKGEAEGDFKNQNNKPRDGFHALSLILTYSFSRFFLDFLRATDLPNSDPRYFGLMLSQYGMAAFFTASLIFFRRRNKIQRS